VNTRASTTQSHIEPEALNLADAARFLGLESAEAARWLIRVGKLRPARLGRRVVVPIEELRRLLRESQ